MKDGKNNDMKFIKNPEEICDTSDEEDTSLI